MSADMSQTTTTPRTEWPRLILPIALVVLGTLILIFTPRQVIDSATDPVGPRFLPYLSGLSVTIGGLADLIMQLRKKGTAAPIGADAPSVSSESKDHKSRLLSYGLILVGIAVWVYCTVVIGYGLSSMILMALTAVAFGLKKPVQMVILVIVTVGVTYYVFAELLQVQLLLIGW